MNKILIIGRLTRDPETNTTSSGIKYTRFSLAVNRPYSKDQTDFIPIVAWRNQADFIDKYIKKGALISIEGRFTSSTYQNAEGRNVTNYEVTAENVQSLQSRSNTQNFDSATATQVINNAEMNKPEVKFENEPKKEKEANNKDVPWELDL